MPRSEGTVEKLTHIAHDPLVRVARRRHHHGNTLDQLPVFFVRPRFQEGHELIDVHGSREGRGGRVQVHLVHLLSRTII